MSKKKGKKKKPSLDETTKLLAIALIVADILDKIADIVQKLR